MGVRPCPECSKPVSTRAHTCPHCGLPAELLAPTEEVSAPIAPPANDSETAQAGSQRVSGGAEGSATRPCSARRFVPLVVAGVIGAAVASAVFVVTGATTNGDARPTDKTASEPPTDAPTLQQSAAVEPTPDLYDKGIPSSAEPVPNDEDHRIEQPLSTAIGSEQREDVRRVQRCLNQQGYGAVEVDGYYGPDTAAGVRAFQRDVSYDFGLRPTGVVDQKTFDALCGGWAY